MFRILCLDGGGTRGAFIAACLDEFQKDLDRPIVDYFDLIAGTSTGGIIAVLLASGVPMSTIKEIYANRLSDVFKPMDAYFNGVYKPISWATSPFLEFFTGVSTDELIQAKYTSDGLEKIVTDLVGDLRLGDLISTRLLITAVDLLHGKPIMFKTLHLPYLYRDHIYRCVDVIKATSAAPTYFNPATIEEGSIYCDGGLWANNPGIVAFSEAVHIASTCQRPEDPAYNISDIRLLSIGTGFARYSHVPPAEGSGFKWWARRTMEIMFDSQSQSACFLLNRMMYDRFYRIDFELPNPDWAHLDNFTHAEEIINFGVREGKRHAAPVKELFFTEPAHPFMPYQVGDIKQV